MIPTQDIVPPFDPTGLTTMSFAQLEQLVSGLSPFSGVGFNISTTDTGLNPNVPDVSTVGKWQYYLWLRIQVSAATVYIWNPGVVSDVVFQKWQSITSASIPDLSITNSKYAPLSITDDKIHDVNASKITGLSVGILPGSTIPTGDLAYNAVTNPASTYGNPLIAPGAVTSAKIAANTVTGGNIALATVAEANMAPSSIGTVELIDSSVTGAKINAIFDLTGKTVTLPATTTINNAAIIAALNSITFISATFPLGAGAIANVAHGLGVTPKQVRWVVVCTTANAGYSIGDEVSIYSILNNVADIYPAMSGGANATNVFCSMLTASVDILHKTTGALTGLTIGSWSAKCYAQS